MARVISIHEYELRRDADGAAFERALRDADMRGLFNLTGLVEHHFLRGFKGARQGAYIPRFGYSKAAKHGRGSGVVWKLHVGLPDIRKRGGCGKTRFWRRS